ncbi:MAG: TIGR01177 family methyltransferase [Haloferacaceae archaeon]
MEFGGEDDAFAALEAGSVAADVTVVAPGLATATGLRVGRVRHLAYTRAAVDLLGRTAADVDAARALVAAASLDRAGTVAVRARDVRGTAGVSTAAAERELGAALVARGFAVDLDDPDHVLRASFGGDACLVGWQVAESVRDYGDRAPTDRPFFQPGAMDPLDARAVANVAGAGPGRRVLDPMCGTGGLLIEAGLVGALVVGADAQRKMVRGARENLRAYLGTGRDGDGGDDGANRDGPDGRAGDGPAADARGAGAAVELLRADATALPLRDDAVDAVVVDAPYGRQSRVVGGDDLLAGVLSEARRVAPRAAVVGDRPLRDAAAAAGWTVEAVHERRVHRSLTRHVHALTA